jgi:hypothetical protein
MTAQCVKLISKCVAFAIALVSCGGSRTTGEGYESFGMICRFKPLQMQSSYQFEIYEDSSEEITVHSSNPKKVVTRSGVFIKDYSCSQIGADFSSTKNKKGERQGDYEDGHPLSKPCTFEVEDFETYLEPGAYPPPTAEEALLPTATTAIVSFTKKELGESIAYGNYVFRGLTTQFEAPCVSYGPRVGVSDWVR